MELIHGGDWAGYKAEYGALPLDFSANISPLGLPDGVKKAIIGALDGADRYPDPLCRELRSGLARAHGLPEEYILCAPGAADLIFRLALAKKPRRGLVTAPTFAEYEQALVQAGCKVERFYLKDTDDFEVTEEILERIEPGLDILFLCEPNNPTGRTTEYGLLRKILEKCVQCGTLLAVDECFGEFLDKPGRHTMQSELAGCKNLIILKAFTKWYAMAGIRLGYALCGDIDLLDAMSRCGQPWGVSSLAQAAGAAALKENGYGRRLRELIAEQRPVLQSGLEALGCRVVPGEANYLLFYHNDENLAPKLRDKGVLLRDCSNYHGLRAGWYRAAVRTEGENQVFLQKIGEVL